MGVVEELVFGVMYPLPLEPNCAGVKIPAAPPDFNFAGVGVGEDISISLSLSLPYV